jgi:hypothetical protein
LGARWTFAGRDGILTSEGSEKSAVRDRLRARKTIRGQE